MATPPEDYCEYVYNPLMRQYQAMMRLINMMRNAQSQSDCNDVQCFTNDPTDPTNPMNSLNRAASSDGLSTTTTFMGMLFIWGLFVFALYVFRPSSMRRSDESRQATKAAQKDSKFSINRSNNNHRNNDDDDNSSVS